MEILNDKKTAYDPVGHLPRSGLVVEYFFYRDVPVLFGLGPLNCGAKSCPPIAFYNPENINTQLDVAATAYLTAEAEYDEATNVLKLPAILSWFRRDFGGKQKMIELLKSKQLLNAGVNPKIKFKKYDWTLYLNNYKL